MKSLTVADLQRHNSCYFKDMNSFKDIHYANDLRNLTTQTTLLILKITGRFGEINYPKDVDCRRSLSHMRAANMWVNLSIPQPGVSINGLFTDSVGII